MRRAVITGLGAVTPVGNDVPTSWANLVAGKSGITRITRFDTAPYAVDIAGEVKDFDPTVGMGPKEVRRTGRDVHLGMAAAMEAIADADVTVDAPGRTGVILGSCVGGMEYTLDQQRVLDERGPGRVSPTGSPTCCPTRPPATWPPRSAPAGSTTRSSGRARQARDAVGDAAEVIKRDQADVIIAGGTEAVLMPVVLAGFCAMRALADGGDDPALASRPFDATRSGFVLAEGAAALVVEELEHALARGADIYAEVVGYGVSNDAYHVATPHPDSIGVIEMMRAALDRSGIAPEEIDYINAHGTSTPYNDPAETKAIKTVFGDHAYKLAVSSIKSMTGHSFGAAGAIEAVATALTIQPRRDPADDQSEYARPRMRSRLRPPHRARNSGANRALQLDGAGRPQRLHHPARVRPVAASLTAMSAPDEQATTLESWAEAHELEPTEAALAGRTPLLRTGLSDTVVDAHAGDLNGRSCVIGELVVASSGMFEGLEVVGVSDVDSVMFTVLVADVDAIGWVGSRSIRCRCPRRTCSRASSITRITASATSATISTSATGCGSPARFPTSRCASCSTTSSSRGAWIRRSSWSKPSRARSTAAPCWSPTATST